jgi:hypothetical protein
VVPAEEEALGQGKEVPTAQKGHQLALYCLDLRLRYLMSYRSIGY